MLIYIYMLIYICCYIYIDICIYTAQVQNVYYKCIFFFQIAFGRDNIVMWLPGVLVALGNMCRSSG